jgi:hypothetical protein
MIIYRVYMRGTGNEGELIGIFPERRRNQARINSESVYRWSKVVFGDTVHGRDIFFIRSTV